MALVKYTTFSEDEMSALAPAPRMATVAGGDDFICVAADHGGGLRVIVRYVDRVCARIDFGGGGIRPDVDGGRDRITGAADHRDGVRTIVRDVDRVRLRIDRDALGI